MLCWICPDCGRDCSPAVRECPHCAQQQNSATDGVLAMVEKLHEAPPVLLLEAAPQQYLLFALTNGHSCSVTETLVLGEEDLAVPGCDAMEAVVRPLVESAEPAPPCDVPVAVKPDPRPAPPADVIPPAVKPAPFLPPVVKFVGRSTPTAPAAKIAPAIQQAALTSSYPPASENAVLVKPAPFLPPVVKFGGLAAPPVAPAKIAQPIEPARIASVEPAARASQPETKATPLLPPVVKFVELPAPPAPPAKTAPPVRFSRPKAALPTAISTPSLGQPPTFVGAPRIKASKHVRSAKQLAKPAPAIESSMPAAMESPASAVAYTVESERFAAPLVRLPQLARTFDPLPAAVELANHAVSISDALQLETETVLQEIQVRLDADEAKIQAIISTFAVKPKCCLLAAPVHVVAAPAPPDFEWRKAPRPVFSARKLPDPSYATLAAPPQKIPLAGPCLPPELQGFLEDHAVEHYRHASKTRWPALFASFVIATGLFLGAGSLLERLPANHDAKTPAATQASGQAASGESAVSAFEPHPFARYVEVTGLRVVADLNHRSQVQYIVVNHSAVQLTGMQIRIAVRSTTEPSGAAPLFTVSAVIPSLAPHQSKEIRTDLDSELRASAIPDWQYLRTDVQVGTQN